MNIDFEVWILQLLCYKRDKYCLINNSSVSQEKDKGGERRGKHINNQRGHVLHYITCIEFCCKIYCIKVKSTLALRLLCYLE